MTTFLEFWYNGKLRRGTIEKKTDDIVTIKHCLPELYEGKVYSTYRLDRMESEPLERQSLRYMVVINHPTEGYEVRLRDIPTEQIHTTIDGRAESVYYNATHPTCPILRIIEEK